MKFTLTMLLCLILFSCKDVKNMPTVDQESLIEGIWAENESENALFWIKTDSIFYFEDLDNPVPFELFGSQLIIGNHPQVKCEILNLSHDSLVFIDEFTQDTTRLYKRDED